MSSSYISFNKGLLVLAALCFFASTYFSKPVKLNRTEYITPPIEIKYLTAGFKHQSSDSFWLRAVQDMDYCEKQITNNTCKSNSWLYSIINLTTELDPQFIEAYYYGALALTILISDYPGASAIFDKGVMHFPNAWPLNYAAAYHALFEEKNKAKASKLYLAAANNGAPSWVRMTAGRLAAESGNTIKASEILSSMLQLEQDPRWVEKLKNKIQEVESQSVKTNK